MTPTAEAPATPVNDKNDINDKTNKALVQIILDRSGSMAGTEARTVDGYNEYLSGLRADKESEYWISLTQFDSPGNMPELTVNYADQPLADVQKMAVTDFVPRGGTPLYDAIGECVRRIDVKGRAVIVVIITDGAENASREFDRNAIKNLIAEKEKLGWTFVFLAADIDAYQAGAAIGASPANTANYVKGAEQALYANMASATMNRMSAVRGSGVRVASMMSFFSEEEKSAIEQPSFDVTGTGTSTQGGRPAAPSGFPGKPAEDTAKPKPRRPWNVSGSGSGR